MKRILLILLLSLTYLPAVQPISADGLLHIPQVGIKQVPHYRHQPHLRRLPPVVTKDIKSEIISNSYLKGTANDEVGQTALTPYSASVMGFGVALTFSVFFLMKMWAKAQRKPMSNWDSPNGQDAGSFLDGYAVDMDANEGTWSGKTAVTGNAFQDDSSPSIEEVIEKALDDVDALWIAEDPDKKMKIGQRQSGFDEDEGPAKSKWDEKSDANQKEEKPSPKPAPQNAVINVRPEDIAADFAALGVESDLVTALNELGYVRPTAIQSGSFKPIFDGGDVILAAETGTGKTLAFALPLIQWMLNNPTRILVVELNRELVYQTAEVFQSILDAIPGGRGADIEVVNVFEVNNQGGIEEERTWPRSEVVVTHPSALNKVFVPGQKRPGFDSVIIDEADFLLSQKREVIDGLLRRLYKWNRGQCQWIAVAATLPGFTASEEVNIRRLIRKTWPWATWIRTVGLHRAPAALKQKFIATRMDERVQRLVSTVRDILTKKGDKDVRIVIFVAATALVADLAKQLEEQQLKIIVFHGETPINTRLSIIRMFNAGKVQILLASSAAARGIDFQKVTHVINYTLPWNAMEYLHSIGRTARNGLSGTAITFHLPEEDLPVAEMRQLVEENETMERAFQQTDEFYKAHNEVQEARKRAREEQKRVRKLIKEKMKLGSQKFKSKVRKERRDLYESRQKKKEAMYEEGGGFYY